VRNLYRTYGLTVESDRLIQALSAVPGEVPSVDLTYFLGPTPVWAHNALALPLTSSKARPNELLPGDATFTVAEHGGGCFFHLSYGDGTHFVIDQYATRLWGESGPGLSFDDLCVYLVGPVMGFVLRQRGLTCLHASALTIRGRAFVLVGEAGAGKSTTAAALALRGWPVLCEDVCALDPVGRQYQVRPGYPRICLWSDSVDFLFASREALPLIVDGWDKRFLALDNARAHFASNGAPLVAVFILGGRVNEDSAPRLELLPPREAVLHLVANTYMNWLLSAEQRGAEFDVLTSLMSSVECFRVFPSTDPARIPDLAELIETQALHILGDRPQPVLGVARSNV
jgi:hypothetical protein